jgi:hypothetical protein
MFDQGARELSGWHPDCHTDAQLLVEQGGSLLVSRTLSWVCMRRNIDNEERPALPWYFFCARKLVIPSLAVAYISVPLVWTLQICC